MKLVLETNDILPKHRGGKPSELQFSMLTERAKHFVRKLGSASFEGQTIAAPFSVHYQDYIVYGGYTDCFQEIDIQDPETAITRAKELIADLNKQAGPLSGRMRTKRYGLIEITRDNVSYWRSWGTDGSTVQKAA